MSTWNSECQLQSMSKTNNLPKFKFGFATVFTIRVSYRLATISHLLRRLEAGLDLYKASNASPCLLTRATPALEGPEKGVV